MKNKLNYLAFVVLTAALVFTSGCEILGLTSDDPSCKEVLAKELEGTWFFEQANEFPVNVSLAIFEGMRIGITEEGTISADGNDYAREIFGSGVRSFEMTECIQSLKEGSIALLQPEVIQRFRFSISVTGVLTISWTASDMEETDLGRAELLGNYELEFRR